LPIASVAAAKTGSNREARATSAPDTPALDGLRILVVDDEPSARELLTTLLQGHGALVRAAESAAQAMDLLQSWHPHVLVSDISMPEEDGYSLMRKVVLATPPGKSVIPAIALTAYARAEDRLRALSAGFLIHMAKPVEPGELLAVVASLAARSGARFEGSAASRGDQRREAREQVADGEL
jgi:CheY-like chemotaxis protein